MWTCPKCGRKLLKENQNHFCGQGPVTVDEYIQEQPEEIRPFLYQVRSAIKEVLPDADEIISWRMPTYKKKRNIIHFAAFKNHIGIYPETRRSFILKSGFRSIKQKERYGFLHKTAAWTL